jgi:hypothetical protein
MLAPVELYICTAFLPSEWQNAIDQSIRRIIPKSPGDWTIITHPALSQEIDQVLREHVWIRIALYILTVLLLTANAFMIRRVWRLLHSLTSSAQVVLEDRAGFHYEFHALEFGDVL